MPVESASPSPRCAHQQEPSTAIASKRNLDHHVSEPPRNFDPPLDLNPAIPAETALHVSEHTGPPIGNPVDAVLATMSSEDGSSSLVWVLTVTDVEVFPSIGPPVCADVAKVVDATTGNVLYGLTGTSFR